MKKIKVFETFAGIGAQHKALEILKNNGIINYEVVGTSEWDVYANLSYHSIHNEYENYDKYKKEIKYLNNFTHSFDSKKPVDKNRLKRQSEDFRSKIVSSLINCKNQGSVTEIEGEKLINNIGHFNMLTYSFPCQDLSVAGSFHGFNQGMAKGSGTRSGLLWEIERILKELNKINELPEYLLLENVKNMVSERHKEDYVQWITFLNDLGYNTQTYILNAKDYGIPQSRERVYALSILNNSDFKDTYKEKGLIIESNKPKDISKELGINKEMKDILKTNYKQKKYKEEAIASTPNRTPSRKRMYDGNPILFTKKESDIIKKRERYKSYRDGFYMDYCRTITTKQDRHPNAGIISLKNTELETQGKNKAKYRFLTPRETFLLMGFEEKDFDKVIKNNEIRKEILYRQAGNSIVVNVLVSIFNILKDK